MCEGERKSTNLFSEITEGERHSGNLFCDWGKNFRNENQYKKQKTPELVGLFASRQVIEDIQLLLFHSNVCIMLNA